MRPLQNLEIQVLVYNLTQVLSNILIESWLKPFDKRSVEDLTVAIARNEMPSRNLSDSPQ